MPISREDKSSPVGHSGGPGPWDEAWRCANCGTEFAMGSGKRGSGNAVITFTKSPTCCGHEMEQVTHISVDPEDCQP